MNHKSSCSIVFIALAFFSVDVTEYGGEFLCLCAHVLREDEAERRCRD